MTDTYEDAQAAQSLLQDFRVWVGAAIDHGADRDWLNARLNAIGAGPILGKAEYRINVPITAVFGRRITAESRAQALEKFQAEMERVAAAGKITADGSYDNVYQLHFTGEKPTFYSGPEDNFGEMGQTPDLEELKTVIHMLVKQAMAEAGWHERYARQALADMGLPELPEVQYRDVAIPATGVHYATVKVFADADESDVQRAAAAYLRGAGQNLNVKAEEIGEAKLVKPTAVRDADGDVVTF